MIYFTPGPTQLHPEIPGWIAEALKNDIGSISHRSSDFKKLYAHTVARLKEVLGLPEGYRVLFLGSATEAFERIAFNLVEQNSFHFVNGSFSSRFFEYVQSAQKQPEAWEANFGQPFQPEKAQPQHQPELVAFTQNETSNGVAWPLEKINQLRDLFPDSLIAMDGVSSLPMPAVDFSQVDTALFSVQKAFGMPAGLGIWIVNEKCVEKARALASKGQMMGPHHDLLTLIKYGDKHQTPETPNVLLIYLLGKVCELFLQKGMTSLRAEGQAKRDKLYQFVDQHPRLRVFVEEQAWRSETVIVAETQENAADINARLVAHGMQVGLGYGDRKNTQLRIANFPCHAPEAVDRLIEALDQVL